MAVVKKKCPCNFDLIIVFVVVVVVVVVDDDDDDDDDVVVILIVAVMLLRSLHCCYNKTVALTKLGMSGGLQY